MKQRLQHLEIQLEQKNSLFLFTHYSLSHCTSLTIFSYSLYFSLLFYLLTHSRSSSRLYLVLTFSRTSLLSLFLLTGRMASPFISSFFPSFLPFNVSHKFNITSSFMWLDFCTSLRKCCWTFVHNYREKDELNSSLSKSYSNKPISLC